MILFKDKIMKRTLHLRASSTRYKNLRFSYIIGCIKKHFNAEEDGKYIVTIIEGTKYRFKEWAGTYHLHDTKTDDPMTNDHGGFCQSAFQRIFFIPDLDKTYDITVKKVK